MVSDERTMPAGTCRRIRKTLLWAVLAAVCMLAVPAGAQNMLRTAKTVRPSAVTLVRTAKGIRFKRSNGKFIKGKWIRYQDNVYCVRSNGYARKGGFFTYGGRTYWADDNGVVLSRCWIYRTKGSYYLKKDGTMAAGETLVISGKKYVFWKNGKLNTKLSDGLKSDSYLFVGDSRVVGMAAAVSDPKASFIGKVSEGYGYLASSAGPRVREILNRTPALNVIFCFGVNDLGNVESYISYYQGLIRDYPKTSFYFMAVNPVRSSVPPYLTNAAIESFNSRLKSRLGKARYIDTYAYLQETGCGYMDNAHYDAATYVRIYNYTVAEITKR